MRSRLPSAGRAFALFLALLVCAPQPSEPGQPDKYEGQSLATVLRLLQHRGLRIVFSSAVVSPDMRVIHEPRHTAPRLLLDEVLEAHGLEAIERPSGVIQVIRARSTRTTGGRQHRRKEAGVTRIDRDGATRWIDAAARYSERVTVMGLDPASEDRAVGSNVTLDARKIQELSGPITDDALRAVQALPRVAAGDDFRSEFSVRGSLYRHVGIVIDGVATPWLQHAMYGRGDSGSLGLLSGAVVERATLQTGAYPRREGDRIGAELSVSLREGSRFATTFRAAAAGANATLLGEGPIGSQQRGSWLVAVRQSYLNWPTRPMSNPNASVFGFTDTHAKLVYDLSPTEQATFTMMAGRARADEWDDRPASDFGDGGSRVALVNFGWRSTIGPRLIISQRAYAVGRDFENRSPDGSNRGHGDDAEIAYRGDVAVGIPGGSIESGGHVQRLVASRSVPQFDSSADVNGGTHSAFDALHRSAWQRSGYVHVRWTAVPHLSLAAGARMASSSALDDATVSRWLVSEWSFDSGWSLNASAGVSHQFPDVDLRAAETAVLRPERATHLDLGIERRLTRTVRGQITLFGRHERDVLSASNIHHKVVDGIMVAPEVLPRYTNALSGSARGVEVLVERQSDAGLSGWIGYSYGKTRHTDHLQQETFWGDFDQRHALNLAAVYRASDRTTMSMRFRSGTNFPVSGYFIERGSGLFAGSARNTVRLPAYARLDLRTSRTFTYGTRRLTLFAEVLNVLNRSNVRRAEGIVRPDTGQAIGFTETLFPRLPSGGIVVEF